MGTVALTGAGGYIGQRLIEHLDRSETCERILATDLVEPTVRSAKLTFCKQDIRERALLDFWRDQGVDTLVHLAFVVNPMHDEASMYDINVNGTLNILGICEQLKIRHVIVASSATAYGAWPDNPKPLREEDPIRVFPATMSYAHHKGLNEKHFDDFVRRNPEILFSVVRPVIVYGPRVDNYLSRYFRTMPFVPLPDGNDQQMQLVHEDDVAQLFTLLAEKRIPGAFNAAPDDDGLRISELAAMIGKPTVRLPYKVMYGLNALLWKLHLLVEAPPGNIDYIAYPWTVDISRAKELLGYQPRYSTRETARIMFETHGYRLVPG